MRVLRAIGRLPMHTGRRASRARLLRRKLEGAAMKHARLECLATGRADDVPDATMNYRKGDRGFRSLTAPGRSLVNSLIRRQTLHEELSAEIRHMILSSELTPGDKVFEPELCDRFQVSRTPLREALKVLAAEGLVQLLPNRGARIALITREEAMQIFPIIGGLEALAGELACQELEDREIARIQELHDVMVGHYRRQEDE
eukprot:gene13319-16912_t